MSEGDIILFLTGAWVTGVNYFLRENMNFKHKPFVYFFLSVLVLVSFGSCQRRDATSTAARPAELVICYLPNEQVPGVVEQRNLMQREMSAAIGIPVREISVADYNAVVEAMRTGRADIASFGPVTYVQAAERAGAEAMVVPAPYGDKNQTGYTSLILVKAGSPIRNLADLRGRTFAFVDPSSTSGNYVPTLEFMNAFPGMSSEDFHANGRFFSSVSYSGGHPNGLRAVLFGDIDAAPIASNILNQQLAAGLVREDEFTIIHESPRIPSSPYAIRGSLPEDIKQNVKQFLLDFTEPEFFQLTMGWSAELQGRFVDSPDSDYDYVRDLMAKVMP